MPETNTASPLPAPEAGASSTSTPPALTVLPDPPPRQSGLTKDQMAQLRVARELVATAQRAEYAAVLNERGIPAAFLTALGQDIEAALNFGLMAVACDGARKDATRAESAAQVGLVGRLRTLQTAARVQHLPANPGALEPYHVGDKLDASRPILEALSQNIITQANTQRPGGIDTSFITNAQNERAAFLATGGTQSVEVGKAKQARAQRNATVAQVTQRRKKIQYAADLAWPPGVPANTQARSDFQLPPHRPYSH